MTIVIVATLPVVPPEPSWTVPPEMVRVPVKVVSPVSVSTPVPVFVSFPPLPEISPAYVVDALLPPTVKVFDSEPVPSEIVAVEPPAIDATVSEKPPRFHVAPLVTVTAVESDRTPAAPCCRVPALIVVVPVYEFTPERSNVPEPVLVRFFDAPAMTPP